MLRIFDSEALEVVEREIVSLEVEGAHKSDTDSITAINTFMQTKIDTSLTDAKIAPDKKVEELTKDINTLKLNNETITTERDNALNSFSSFKKDITISNAIAQHIPENTILPKEDIITLMGGKVKADINEHGVVFGVGADGQPIKNSTTLEPLPIGDVVKTFFDNNTNLLTKSSGGGGGTDSVNSDGKLTLKGFEKEMTDSGITPGSEKFNAEMSVRIQAGTLAV